MPEPTPEAWAQIRHDYEHTDRPLAHICAEHDITIPMMRYRMKRWEWTRRKPLIPRQGPPPVPAMQQIEQAATFAQPTPAPTLPLSGGGSIRAAPVHPTPPAFADASAGDPPPQEPAPGRAQARPGWEGEENAPAAIVPRLQSAVARVLPAIEATIARLAGGAPRDVEHASRALSSLTRTLRELNALLAQHKTRLDAAEPFDDMPEDIDAFRINLARRIEAFVASRTNPDGTIQDMSWGAK